MHISIIVAMDQNQGIGRQNRIPWHLSADLKNFKALTMGHHLIMGRKTCQAIGRPLPGRVGIVLTRNLNFTLAGYQVAHSIEAALDQARSSGDEEAFIAGGGEIYAQALPLASRIHLTRVQTVVEADAFFPSFDPASWVVIESWQHAADAKNDFDFIYQVMERGANS